MDNSLLKDVLSLFAIVDPIGAIPLFLTLTNGLSNSVQLSIARRAAFSGFIILLFVLFFGKWFLEFMGISLPSLRVAGGLLFIIMGLQLMLLENQKSHYDDILNRSDISVVPLAIPMLSGPGAMGAVILLGSSGVGIYSLLSTSLIIGVVMFLSYLCFRLSQKIGSKLGSTGLNILSKVSGLIVVSIGVEFIINGIKQMWFMI